LPKKLRSEKEQEKKIINNLILRVDCQEQAIKKLEETVNNLPKYREQSLKIQEELKQADVSIVDLCKTIKDEVMENRKEVLTKLERLEEREKNALRAKILE
jgi:ABC-type transporter Mla subunit MlaD